jgi:hypothetical protein
LDEPVLLWLPDEEGLALVLEEDGREFDVFCCGRTYSELEREGRLLFGEV